MYCRSDERQYNLSSYSEIDMIYYWLMCEYFIRNLEICEKSKFWPRSSQQTRHINNSAAWLWSIVKRKFYRIRRGGSHSPFVQEAGQRWPLCNYCFFNSRSVEGRCVSNSRVQIVQLGPRPCLQIVQSLLFCIRCTNHAINLIISTLAERSL